MPVYLFTLHAYGSWLPDHQRGYTKRNASIFPTDTNMASYYRDNMSQDAATFDRRAQQIIIDAVLEKTAIKRWTCYAVATDPTHAHILVGWREYTPWLDARRGLKSSINRQLNRHHTRRQWFAQSGSRRRITDPKRFDHLIQTDLPHHRGLTHIAPPHH